MEHELCQFQIGGGGDAWGGALEKWVGGFNFVQLTWQGGKEIPYLGASLYVLFSKGCGLYIGGRILGRNWDKSLKSVPPCYSQSPLLTEFSPPPSLEKKWFETGLYNNVNIVYANLKSENSQDYAQKPQRNCTFTNSAS